MTCAIIPDHCLPSIHIRGLTCSSPSAQRPTAFDLAGPCGSALLCAAAPSGKECSTTLLQKQKLGV